MALRRGTPVALAAGVALAIVGFGASQAAAAGPTVCRGTLHRPGVLKGTYRNGVIVRGVCDVKSGRAHVIGTLTVTRGSVLAAAFGGHHSSLTVSGNLLVDQCATAILGCKVNPTGTGFPCIDEPNASHPTLTSHAVVTGNLIARSALGVLVHNSSIGGNVKQSGGGGGLSCAPKGVFSMFKSPVYSDYEDSTIGGNVLISELDSCWLGFARDRIRGTLTISRNEMADPDAIEVLASRIGKNLACRANGHPSPMPPGDMPVWDSADLHTNPPGVIYPRISEPNRVGGKRSGQCVTASPTTLGGPPAAHAF